MKKTKKSKSIFLVLILTIIVLYFSLRNDFDNVISELRNANIWWIAIAVVSVIGYYILSSLSMYLIIKKYNKNYTIWQSVKLKFKTKFFDTITPTSTGGQPYQIYSLTSSGISVLDSTNISLQSFVVFQVALVLLGIIAVISNNVLNIFAVNNWLRLLVCIGFVINTAIALFLFLVSFTTKFNNFIYGNVIKLAVKLHFVKDANKTAKMYEEYVENVRLGTTSLLKNKKEFIFIIFLNFIGLCLEYLVPLFILFSIGDFTSFNMFQSIIATAYVYLMGSFIPLPGGTGGLEYGFLAFFGNFLVGGKLTTLMLLWRFITYYFIMILGAIALNIRKKDDSL